MKRISIFFAVCLVSCQNMQTSWFNPNKSNSDFYSDQLICEKEAQSVYPATFKEVQISTGGYTQDAIGTPNYTPPETDVLDMNEGNRNGYINTCMQSKGWELLTNAEIAKRTVMINQPKPELSSLRVHEMDEAIQKNGLEKSVIPAKAGISL